MRNAHYCLLPVLAALILPAALAGGRIYECSDQTRRMFEPADGQFWLHESGGGKLALTPVPDSEQRCYQADGVQWTIKGASATLVRPGKPDVSCQGNPIMLRAELGWAGRNTYPGARIEARLQDISKGEKNAVLVEEQKLQHHSGMPFALSFRLPDTLDPQSKLRLSVSMFDLEGKLFMRGEAELPPVEPPQLSVPLQLEPVGSRRPLTASAASQVSRAR
ncbi:hypothetical protein [Chitinilyticum piscinae]|uniref:DUF4124 domain-containing protein n=1 Tax=Chitinilyticum piscinae TaxID=2866724 RepID=A0A8J7FHU7_9NEIS|nr:hypothetical protein [Chitinilyticum piscinae]MBE9609723.1 hypothetical protein [Chitinilyticum piscinae]